MIIEIVERRNHIELLFRNITEKAICNFFTDFNSKKNGSYGYKSPEFLHEFLTFLLGRNPSRYESNILATLIAFVNGYGDEFYNGIDGYITYGGNSIDMFPDPYIDVDAINQKIYNSVNIEIWDDYCYTSDSYLVFLTICIITGHGKYVRQRLIHSIPVLGIWEELFINS